MAAFKTAPRRYFDLVIKEMNQSGFELMAWVTMNSRKHIYHVHCQYAQESRLFFRARDKAMIVTLVLNEVYFEHTGRRIYWNGFVDYSYKLQQWLSTELHMIGLDFIKETRSLDVLAWDPIFKDGLFKRIYGFEQLSKESLINPIVLADRFSKMLEILKPYLHSRFKELQVTSYAPHGTFPNQEKDFWSKFPLYRLRKVVINGYIWGSDFE